MLLYAERCNTYKYVGVSGNRFAIEFAPSLNFPGAADAE